MIDPESDRFVLAGGRGKALIASLGRGWRVSNRVEFWRRQVVLVHCQTFKDCVSFVKQFAIFYQTSPASE
jgi:hypothetical protein